MKKYIVESSAGRFVTDIDHFTNDSGYNDKEIKAIKKLSFDKFFMAKYATILCKDM